MEKNPLGEAIKAKIIDVKTAERDGIHGESIIVRFTLYNKSVDGDFGSPASNMQNLFVWRQIVLSFITDALIDENDVRIKDFNEYRNAIIHKDVYIGFDGEEVYAIGTDPTYMFFPDMYGLWQVTEDEKDSKI